METSSVVWFVIAAVFFALFVFEQFVHERNERTRLNLSLESATNARERALFAEDQTRRVLRATHHELNREVTMVGFAVDDLVEESSADNLEELLTAFAKLEEGRDNVAALAKLSSRDVHLDLRDVSATDLGVLTEAMNIKLPQDDQVLHGDPLLLRTLVKNVARNAEAHGGASELTIDIDRGRLILRDNGDGCTQDEIERAWATGTRPGGTIGEGMQIIRQISEAHGAEVSLKAAEGEGLLLEIQFPGAETEVGHDREFSDFGESSEPEMASESERL